MLTGPDEPRTKSGGLIVTIAASVLALGALTPVAWGGFQWALGTAPWDGSLAGPALHGYTTKAAPLALGWWDRSFQTTFSELVAERLPLRNWLIRINNQFDYDVLRGTSLKTANVIIGLRDVLFEGAYVYEHLGYRPLLSEERIREVGVRVLHLETLLRQRGISLIVFATPGKPSFAADAIPATFYPFHPERPRSYDRLVTIFRELGVSLVDGREQMWDFARSHKLSLFPRGGMHWNYLGAYVAAEPLVRQLLKERSPDPNSRLVLDGVTFAEPPSDADQDLLTLLNLMFPNRRYPSPVLKFHLEGKALPKPLTIVGTSFVFQLHFLLQEAAIAPAVRHLFYLSSLRNCGVCAVEPLPASWPKLLLEDSSALVLEINEGASFGTAEPAAYIETLLNTLIPLLERGG